MKRNAKLYYRTEPTNPRIRAYLKHNLKNTKTFKLLDVSEATLSAPKGIRPENWTRFPHYCSANSVPLLWNFMLARQMKSDYLVSS